LKPLRVIRIPKPPHSRWEPRDATFPLIARVDEQSKRRRVILHPGPGISHPFDPSRYREIRPYPPDDTRWVWRRREQAALNFRSSSSLINPLTRPKPRVSCRRSPQDEGSPWKPRRGPSPSILMRQIVQRRTSTRQTTSVIDCPIATKGEGGYEGISLSPDHVE
jgi:hypothetical protein